MIKNIFVDRYNFNHDLLDKMVVINGIMDIYTIDTDKSLFLDTRSFNNIFMFLKCKDIHIFVNDDFKPIRSSIKSLKYYGFYDYQNFDIEQMLQLNFDIFKKINHTVTDTALVSSPLNDSTETLKYLGIQEKNIIFKTSDIHHKNLFESFDVLHMYHKNIDTNNRAIPEAFFYGKRVYIRYADPSVIDSVRLRYNDCTENGVMPYWLDIENKMIKGMLE